MVPVVARCVLGHDILNHVSMDVSQPIVPPGIAVGEFLVIQSHEMEDGCLEVMDVNSLIDSGETEFIS